VPAGPPSAMRPMSHPEKPANGVGVVAAASAGGSAARTVASVFPLIVLVLVVALVGLDVASDVSAGTTAGHVVLELGIVAIAVAGSVALWAQLLRARRRARSLEGDLVRAAADGERFREDSGEHLRGLAEAIDRQFGRWGLSGAERDVALLLLKGLALKEIAAARDTSERTVRQQALAVYRKAGLAGRAELSAFFLEDLLAPAATVGTGGARD
jgi:DNA-binding CsgD family transcriptional regulator